MISSYIGEIVGDGTILYLPTVGTIYQVGGVVVYAPSDGGEDLIAILSSRYGMANAESEYNQWLAKNCREYDTYTEYTIHGLGTLRLYASGALFELEEPDVEVALNDNAQEAILAAISAADNAHESLYTINEDEPEDDELEEQDDSEDDSEDDSSKAGNWRLIAIILFVMLLIVSILAGYYFGKVAKHKHTTVVEVVRDTVYIEASKGEAEAPSFGRYHIISGAFLNKHLADKMAESYIVRGYNAFVFYSEPKGYHMVSVISGDGVEELMPKIKDLPKLEYDEPYWIYEYYIENK